MWVAEKMPLHTKSGGLDKNIVALRAPFLAFSFWGSCPTHVYYMTGLALEPIRPTKNTAERQNHWLHALMPQGSRWRRILCCGSLLGRLRAFLLGASTPCHARLPSSSKHMIIRRSCESGLMPESQAL